MATATFPNIEIANNTIRVPELNNTIIKFCKSFVQNHDPQYIPYIPEEFRVSLKCAFNVYEKVKHDGGQPIYGWDLVLVPHLWISADFHVIWKSPKGEVLDVTPHTPKRERTLFLEDDLHCEMKGEDFLVNGSKYPPKSKNHPIAPGLLIKRFEDLIDECAYHERCRDSAKIRKCKSQMDKTLGQIFKCK